jgi:hypothetical protein
MTRRFFVANMDRPLKAGAVDCQLPSKMEDERPYVLLLIMRAYFSLIHTLGEAHVDEIMTPDLKRDAEEIIAGNDDTLSFLRNWCLRFDKSGIRSSKRIPIEVLINEWKYFKEENNGGKKCSTKMKKVDFLAILRVTGAAAIINQNAEKNTGGASTFHIPRYAKRYGSSFAYESNFAFV